jgi:hypothetical protein
MNTTAAKPATTPIPVQLSEPESLNLSLFVEVQNGQNT